VINGKDPPDFDAADVLGAGLSAFLRGRHIPSPSAPSASPGRFLAAAPNVLSPLSGEGYSVDPYSIMLPKGVAEFREARRRCLGSISSSAAARSTGSTIAWFMKPNSAR
jgi:hypothetical protein